MHERRRVPRQRTVLPIARIVPAERLLLQREREHLPRGRSERLPRLSLAGRTAPRDRWLKGVPEDKKKDLIPDGWFEQWAQTTHTTDPVGSKHNPPVLRAPNGTLHDTKAYWSSGKPYYDPADIKVPVLIVHAEWDQDLPNPMPREVFSRLTSAPYRRLVEIGEGTHTVTFEETRELDDGALVHAGHDLAAGVLHRNLEGVQLAVAAGVAGGRGDARAGRRRRGVLHVDDHADRQLAVREERCQDSSGGELAEGDGARGGEHRRVGVARDGRERARQVLVADEHLHLPGGAHLRIAGHVIAPRARASVRGCGA